MEKNTDDLVNGEERVMPVLHSDQYKILESNRKAVALTNEEKVIFLNEYYRTGNKTKSAVLIKRAVHTLDTAMKYDTAFHADFEMVKAAMKHNLEQTMYQRGLTPGGYMDRITWLRKNYGSEYDPNYQKKDNPTEETLKKLSDTLSSYDLTKKDSEEKEAE